MLVAEKANRNAVVAVVVAAILVVAGGLWLRSERQEFTSLTIESTEVVDCVVDEFGRARADLVLRLPVESNFVTIDVGFVHDEVVVASGEVFISTVLADRDQRGTALALLPGGLGRAGTDIGCVITGAGGALPMGS